MSLLSHALAALDRGFHIFPVQPGDKTPHRIYPDKPYTIRWSEAATNDRDQVIKWWGYSPGANIGVACKQSGLLVVDCDAMKEDWELRGTPWEELHRYGPRVHGVVVLSALCEKRGQDYRRLLDTYRVATGSGGCHFYYRWPENEGQASQASIVKGVVDIRCNGGLMGGYVLGEGSVTAAGPYELESFGRTIRRAPQWLVDECKEKPPSPLRANDSAFRQPGTADYSGLVVSVASAPEGNRSNVLYWAATAMVKDGATEEKALNVLASAAIKSGLHEREAIGTIRSAYRRFGGSV